jgi:hypothetical protein
LASGSVTALAAALAACGFAGSARAQADLLSPSTIHGVVDLRAAAADGEPSFRDDGLGKARYGGGGTPAFHGNLQVAFAALEWTPRLSWDVSAVVDLYAQPDQERTLDIGQAYLVYKPLPRAGIRFTARAGYFYPPVSQEHEGRAWTTVDTITPSAINSWIGEEGKVVGFEAGASRKFAGQEVGLTAGLFGYDDTAGTLLTFRGWSLSDIQAQARGAFQLPPLASAFFTRLQDGETYSTRNIDGRVGWYGRLDWRPDPRLQLNATYWNNRGDMTSRTLDHQWAWATDFWNLGARWDADERTWVLAQAMTGRTVMGRSIPVKGRFTDVRFRSAYLLLGRKVGADSLTVRADVFDVFDHSALSLGDTNEHGWAATGAWRHPLTRVLDVRLEALRIDSDRPARAVAGEAPNQSQTVLQSSLRLSF